MFAIGKYNIASATILAPMAGVTDLPFRRLCRNFGAGLTVSEMVTADTRLWTTDKSRLRLPHSDEPEPRIIQIAGGDADMLANAARQNVELGAQIIDINMGCPAKKVCKRAAGSALLKDEKLVAQILETVVSAVDVPVTLKIRTGWSPEQKNALTVARIAEESGIQALAVHGRTRACKFNGDAEYDTIAEVVQSTSLPVFANGDIISPEAARHVLAHTGAQAVMIGRAAQGRPWIFREINHYLDTGEHLAPPTLEEIQQTLINHVTHLHNHYGDFKGVRIARKHVGWYLQTLPGASDIKCEFNGLAEPLAQLDSLNTFFHRLITNQEQAA